MNINNDPLKKILQNFHDDAFKDEILVDLIAQLTAADRLSTTAYDEIMEKIFDHLDHKFQTDVRSHLNKAS